MKIAEFFNDKKKTAIVVLFLFLIAGVAGGIMETGYTTKSTPTGLATQPVVKDDNTNTLQKQASTPDTNQEPRTDRNRAVIPNPSSGGSGNTPETPQGVQKVGEITITSGKSTSVGTINK